MPTPRIGIATRTLRRPLRACLETAGRLEVDGVEVDLRTELPPAELSDSAIRQIRKLMEDQRLRLGAASFPTRRGFGDSEQLERRIAAAAQAMTCAKQLGASLLLLAPGDPLPEADSSADSILRESLTSLAVQGDRIGVTLGLIASGGCVQAMRDLLAALPGHAVGACVDPAQLVSAGVGASDAVALLGTSVEHVYASDAVRDLSTQSATPVELGRGSVEWPELLGALEEHNYRGWLTLKHRQGGDFEELENAVSYLRNG